MTAQLDLRSLVESCLVSDPVIVSGDYTVVFSSSKSGALSAGILLFSDVDLPKRALEQVEYRLVSLLLLLMDVEGYVLDHPQELNFETKIPTQFKNDAAAGADRLIAALSDRGVQSDLAIELVHGTHRSA